MHRVNLALHALAAFTSQIASHSFSDGLKFQNFPGGLPPDPPTWHTARAHSYPITPISTPKTKKLSTALNRCMCVYRSLGNFRGKKISCDNFSRVKFSFSGPSTKIYHRVHRENLSFTMSPAFLLPSQPFMFCRHCCQICSCCSGVSRSYLSRLVWSHGFVRVLQGTHARIVPVSSSMYGVLVRALRVFPAWPCSHSNLSGSPWLAWSLCSRSSGLSFLRWRFLSHQHHSIRLCLVASMAVWERYYGMM